MKRGNAVVAERIFQVALCAITVPLLLGGLVAAGESGDVRVLLYGAIILAVYCVIAWTRKLSRSWRVNAHAEIAPVSQEI